MMTIRRTVPSDVEELLGIFANARAFMAKMGNPTQWRPDYPSRELILEDIALEKSYVCEEDGRIEGTFVMALGEDPTYAYIEGEWKNSAPYATLHRIASAGRKAGVTDEIVSWAFRQLPNLRGDTHADNLPMQHAFERNGFERCGIIYIADGSPRIAYQKTR